MQPKLVIVIVIVSGLCGLLLSLYVHKPQASPTSVTEIETFHYPALFVQQLAGDPHAGEKIYKEFCASCHSPDPVIDIKAPRVNDKKAWAVRRQWGMDTLMKMVTRGVGAMPARGGCFECSDEQLREAIRYMMNFKE